MRPIAEVFILVFLVGCLVPSCHTRGAAAAP
jgi:hypothetical protein